MKTTKLFSKLEKSSTPTNSLQAFYKNVHKKNNLLTRTQIFNRLKTKIKFTLFNIFFLTS